MEKHVFIDLCKELKVKYGLKGSRSIYVEELVAMFLMILGHEFGNQVIRERFQHSREKASRYFTHILNVVLKMTRDIINPIDRQFKNVPRKIHDDNH